MNNYDVKKKVLFFSILGIFLFIGVSYAIWQLNFTQTNSNTIAAACFDITFADQDNISLQNTYPMLDSEGASLTPYQFTITNHCAEYASYQVNLEVLNTTTLDSSFIKVMFDEGTPKLLTNYTPVTKTLSDASSAYKLTTGFLNPNESVTYTLRLWIDENVTMEDNISNKTFASKITIASTYKASAPTSLEECEARFGEGAINCSIIAQADTANDKCLGVDENGMILNPGSIMSAEEEPIICTMEDDYGTSYYLRGNHQNNKVKFADMCWILMRITGTGGYKLLYTGDLDENGKCTTTRASHPGFLYTVLTLSGNKVYGTSYTKEGSTYTLTNTSTLNWTNDLESIIGKYTCGNNSTSCANPYYVVSEWNSIQGYVLKMGVNTNFAFIGRSSFNYPANSPSYVGYMYNDSYSITSKNMINSATTLLSSQTSNTSNFYYGDSISYSGGYYYITNQDGSNVAQLSWEENYENNLVGKYTCRGTSKYNDTTLRCSIAYKVLDTTTKANTMIAEYLSGGRLAIGTIKLSNDFTDNGDGTYTLNSPVTEKGAMEWYDEYSIFKNYYVCEDWNQTTCTNMYKIINASPISFGNIINVEKNYYYGSSFSYTEGLERPYTLTNIEQTLNINDIHTHHYTCFNTSNNTCQELYYIYYINETTLYYIKLNGNETGPQALNKMVNNNDINVKDSTIKGAIDWWYEQNIKNTDYENYLEDTIFCNDRTIDDLGGWSETSDMGSYLQFNGFNKKYYLKCPNKRDAFTVSDAENGNSALTYPIGLLTTAEHSLVGTSAVLGVGDYYWFSNPDSFDYSGASEGGWHTWGDWLGRYGVENSYGIRPSISLKPGTKFIAGGDGSATNPYEVE